VTVIHRHRQATPPEVDRYYGPLISERMSAAESTQAAANSSIAERDQRTEKFIVASGV
jgi:hypothetical protein